MRRLSACALLTVAAAVAGCGGSGKKTASSVSTTRPAPTYRAGQYCSRASERLYRAHGLTCTAERHLAASKRRASR